MLEMAPESIRRLFARPMKRVLVLRPEPGASATVRPRARTRARRRSRFRLFEIEPVAWDAPEPPGFDGLLLTSANAVRHGGEDLNELRGAAGPCRRRTLPPRRPAEQVSTSPAVGEAGVDRLLEVDRAWA